MSLFAGYAGTPSSSAYLEMWQDIQLNHIDWETWEYPPAGYKDLDELMQSLDTSLTDQEKQETAAKILMPVENRLRLMLGLAEASETADLWCLEVQNSEDVPEETEKSKETDETSMSESETEEASMPESDQPEDKIVSLAQRIGVTVLSIVEDAGSTAGIVCSMLAHRLKDKYQLSVLILLAPWPAAFVLTGFRGCFEGLKAWINLMITQWNKVHEDSIALLSGNIVQHDLWASTVVIALLCGEVTYFLITLRKYGFCALYCILWVMVQLFSSAFSPAACIGLFVPVVAVYISNQRTEMTHRGLLWVAGLTAVLVICAVAVPQEDMLSMAKAKSALKLSLSNMRYGQPTLPEGHVDEADQLKANENEMFTVTSEQKKNLYFKGYSGGRYIDGCWKPLSNADYSGEYSGMLKWLAKLNFHPLTQAAEYYALSDAEQEDIPETNELQMNVAGAYRYPVYAPASLYQAKGRHAKYKKDAEMISKGIVGARHYTLDEISNAKPSELMIAQNWVSDPQNEAQEQYVQAEAVYREFVYDHYLTVDADLAETVQHIFWDDYDETNDGIYSAVCQIRNKLEGTVFYTYEPKKPPQGEDPILWFLTQSHEGNAVLYASAAVEALRTHGVPARYAEGYYVSDTDFQKSEDGSVAVTG